jgi:lantibiotic modifying enzyme
MRPIIFSLFLWPISIVPSLQATPDLTYLNLATQAANWILSREVDEKPKAGYWPSRADLPIEEKRDLYYGNAGTLVFLHELNRAAGREEYAEAMQRGIRFLEENLPNVKLYGLYDGVAGIAFSLSQLSDDPGASAVCSKAIDDLIAGVKKQSNGGVRWNDDSDIIGGSAGIGLTLLSLGQQLRRPELINLAIQAGTDLLARSVPTVHGRYWLHKIVAEKQYPNFSHGTAGIAHFLLKLYEQTGENHCLDAAIDGAA